MTSPSIMVGQARPSAQPKPVYFRSRQKVRGVRNTTRANISSTIVPLISAVGRKYVREDEPSGAQRWLSMVDENEEGGDYQDLILEIVPETNEYIASILEPLNFVSVMGPTRSGKSTLMNLLAECKEKELFASAGGAISFTKGVDLGNKIMTVEEFSRADGGQEVSPIVPRQQIAFLDTEGQGDQGDNYDISLFTPAILCSRIVIFNTKEVAKDTLLTQLALMTTIAQQINLGDEEVEENPGPKFGHLVIVINQYTLGGSVEDLKKNILDIEPGTSAPIKRRNEIRRMLRAQFEDVSLHMLLGNTLKPGVAEELGSGTKKFLLMTDFLPAYVEQFGLLRRAFAEILRHPRLVARESLSGQSVAGLVPSIVNAINSEDPLDIPDLWEQTQSAAISKASLVFRDMFRAACDVVLQSPDLLTTAQVTRLLDAEIDRLLYEMERTLSYLPPAKIAATRATLSEDAKSTKQNTLSLHLIRIKSDFNIKLAALITSLPVHIGNEFPTLLVSNATATTRMEQLKARLLNEYKNEVIGYDPAGFPEGYQGIFDTAFQNEQTMILDLMRLAWVQWVVTKDEEKLHPVRLALEKLTTETLIGDLVKWKKRANDLRAETLLGYNGAIDATYLWTHPADVKAAFVIKLTEIIALSEENFKNDEEAIKQLIDSALKTQIQYYQNHLFTALPPRKEPGDYETIINTSVPRTMLQTLMRNSNVSDGLTNQYLLSFDTQTAVLINTFSTAYTQASNDFLAYLQSNLVILVPHRVGDFELLADKILITKDLAKTALRSALDSHGDTVLVAFETDIRIFGITQDAGRIRVAAARRDLMEGIEMHRGTKFALLKDEVNEWNRERLSKDTEPVLTGVVDYSINTSAKLQTAIYGAKTNFWSRAVGDQADKLEAWATFESQTAGLYQNVSRASALFIGKVNATEGSTSEMEKIVMRNINNDIADAANLLGMSWINSLSQFLVETTDKGGKDGRSHLYKNIPDPNGGYEWDKPTCIRFHKWRVEFSDFRFDDPIIQELVPFWINTYTPPTSDEDTIVNVTLNHTEKETITNTNAVMLKFDSEYTSSAGVAGVASTSVKLAFGGSGTFTDAKANEIGFSISINSPVTCPANRKSVITHLGFKQKTSMTYTAKVKIVPEVQFTRGFTAYGGGPYTDPKNTRPNYHKKYTGTRHYDDIDNGYSDEFKLKAAADSDPWAWRACINRFPQVQRYVNSLGESGQYELYVRGKWEGINGWNHVIKRSISVPDSK